MISSLLRRGLLVLTLALGGSIALPSPSLAQNVQDPAQRSEGRGQRGANMARLVDGLRSLLADLKLSEEQKAKTDEVLLKARDEMQRILQDPNTEQRDKLLAVRQAWQNAQSGIREALDEEQKNAFDAGLEKLRADMTQGRGGMQLVQRFERALAAVELSEEQKPRIRAVIDQTTQKLEALREEARGAGDPAAVREKAQALRDEVFGQLREILTPDQLARVREAMTADRPRPAGGGRPQVQADPPVAPTPTTARTEAGTAGLSASGSSTPLASVAVGDKVPPFALVQLDGKRLDNAALAGKATVLMFGSYSSPALRDRAPRFQELASSHRNDARFILIYTAEMHPEGADQPARNKGDKISMAAHQTQQDRAAAARVARDALQLKVDVAPDTMESTLQKVLGVGPNGAAILRPDGTLAFRQDWADAYALERALREVTGKE